MLTAKLESGDARAASRPPQANATSVQAWSRIWFDLAARDWWSLALVSATPDDSAMHSAERLLECARAYHSGPMEIADARTVTPGEVAEYSVVLDEFANAHQRVLIVLPSPLSCAAAIPLARAADAALLVVPLGATVLRDARRTVAALGHARFFGSMTIRDR